MNKYLPGLPDVATTPLIDCKNIITHRAAPTNDDIRDAVASSTDLIAQSAQSLNRIGRVLSREEGSKVDEADSVVA